MSKLAYVFPGQGSQSVGMVQEIAHSHSQAHDCFTQVSNALGYDLWQLVQKGPEDKLNQTEFTQVAMLTADVAVYKALGVKTAKPSFMAGHSLGEYAALVCAGALELTDAAKLVQKRGQLMQQFIPLGTGAMAAIVGLSDAEVLSICQTVSAPGSEVVPANYNAIGQVVIAGHTVAVEKAVHLAVSADARLAKIIPVSVPCHCPLLTEAAEVFADYLADVNINVPEYAVISNVDLSVYSSAEQIKRLLKEQLYSPVRWVETIQLLKNNHVDAIIECGPGKVLSGLIKRIDKSINVIPVYDNQSIEMAASQSTVSEKI